MDEKRILITGASRGIGAAISDLLAADGHFVAGTATTLEGSVNIEKRLSAIQQNAKGYPLEVCNTKSIEATLDSFAKDFGDMPEILINNAGITRDNLLMRMSEDEWDSMMQTNLRSVFLLSKACLRSMMKARFGRIVSITSVVGSIGNAGQTNYAAAKAGINGFTRSLAREVGSRNITVNSVAPGFIDTDMTKALSDAQKQTLLENIPISRLGDPKDIANAVQFLVSDRASYITGQTLHVNGGMFMQ